MKKVKIVLIENLSLELVKSTLKQKQIQGVKIGNYDATVRLESGYYSTIDFLIESTNEIDFLNKLIELKETLRRAVSDILGYQEDSFMVLALENLKHEKI